MTARATISATASAADTIPAPGTAASAADTIPAPGTTASAADTIPAPGTAASAADTIPAPGTAASAADTIPAPGTSTTTVTEPDVREVTDDGDHDRFAHYTRRADANRAYVEGTPVRALCGKVWVPSRDPSRYPVCPECTKIRERLRRRAFN